MDGPPADEVPRTRTITDTSEEGDDVPISVTSTSGIITELPATSSLPFANPSLMLPAPVRDGLGKKIKKPFASDDSLPHGAQKDQLSRLGTNPRKRGRTFQDKQVEKQEEVEHIVREVSWTLDEDPQEEGELSPLKSQKPLQEAKASPGGKRRVQGADEGISDTGAPRKKVRRQATEAVKQDSVPFQREGDSKDSDLESVSSVLAGQIAGQATTEEKSQKESGAKKYKRSGKWTMEEEEYAAQIIEFFKSGLLNIKEGTTLRTYVAKKLECDPMRVSKKFGGTGGLGKLVYRRAAFGNPKPNEIVQAHQQLLRLERKFRANPVQNEEDEEFPLDLSQWDSCETSATVPPPAIHIPTPFDYHNTTGSGMQLPGYPMHSYFPASMYSSYVSPLGMSFEMPRRTPRTAQAISTHPPLPPPASHRSDQSSGGRSIRSHRISSSSDLGSPVNAFTYQLPDGAAVHQQPHPIFMPSGHPHHQHPPGLYANPSAGGSFPMQQPMMFQSPNHPAFNPLQQQQHQQQYPQSRQLPTGNGNGRNGNGSSVQRLYPPGSQFGV